MNVYIVSTESDKGYAALTNKNVDMDSLPTFFDGTSKLSQWKEPDVKWFTDNGRTEVVDFPFYEYGSISCSAKAWQSINHLLEDDVENLPLSGLSVGYYLLNVINVVDCIDKSRSIFKSFSNGSIKEFQKYHFDTSTIIGSGLFKTPHMTSTKIYSTDLFRDLYISNGFKGLTFIKVFPY